MRFWGLVIAAAAAGSALPAGIEAQQPGRAGGRTEQQRERWEQRDERRRNDTRAGRATGRTEDARSTRTDRERWENRDRDRDRDWERERNRKRDREWNDHDRRRNKKSNARFCRDGSGHPVFGREWCRDRGWGANGDWGPVDFGRVIWSAPTQRRDVYRGSALDAILGRSTRARFDSMNRRSEPLDGTWLRTQYGDVLRLTAGSRPFAELLDRNRDGRVDLILMNRNR